MRILLSVAAVLLLGLVGIAALLFGREWARSVRAARFRRELSARETLIRRLREGSGAEFAAALREAGAIPSAGLREAVLEAASERASPEAAMRLAGASDSLGITARHMDVLAKSSSWEERAMAAERLGRIGSGLATPRLLAAVLDVKDEDEDVRGAALRALGRIRDPKALPGLIEALGVSAASVPPRIAEIIALYGDEAVAALTVELRNMESDVRRMWAAEILGWLGSPRAAVALIDALGDVSAEVRAKAAGALGKLGEARAVDRLMEMLLADPVPFVRTRVAQALGAIGHPRVIDSLIRVLKDPEWWVRVRAIEALEQIGSAASGALLVALEDEDPEVRRRSAMALERMGYVHENIAILEKEGFRADVMKILALIGTAGVTEVIFGKIGTAEGQARKLLVRLAGDIRNPLAGPILASLLARDIDASLRSRVVEALGKLAYRDAAAEILSCLRDPNDWVRRAAAMALSAIGPEDHADELLRLLKDPVAATRKAVCRVLVGIPGEKVVRALDELLSDPAAEVRSEAARVAGSMRREELSPRVVPLLLDVSEDVRVAAADALSAIGGDGAALPLLRASRGASDRFLEAASEAVAAVWGRTFRELLALGPAEPSREQRAVLLAAACRGEGDGRLAYVREAIGSDDPWVRRHAVGALRGFPADEVLGHVVIAMNDPDEAVRDAAVCTAAFAGGAAPLREVARRAGDPNGEVRFHVALALGLSANREFLAPLRALLGDPEAAVRAAAALSLCLLEDPVFRANIKGHLQDEGICEKGRALFVPGSPDPLVARALEEARRRGSLETNLFTGGSRFAVEKELAERARVALAPEERAKALEVCAAVATGQSYTAALAILKNDPSPDVRARALELIVAIRRDAEVAGIVGGLLADPQPWLRVKAARILGDLEFPEAVEALLTALDTNDRELREAVTNALSAHLLRDPGKADALMEEIPSTKTRKLGLVWLLGKTRSSGAMSVLLRYLEDEDGDVRASAVGALAKFRPGIVARHLRRALSDPNGRVRAAAVNALSRMRHPEWEETISGMLYDPDPFVRQRAAVALLRMGSRAAAGRVRSIASEPSELSPVWIAGGIMLGILPAGEAQRHPDTARFLRELLPEEEARAACRESLEPDRRRSAFHALRAMGAEAAAREAAESLAADPDPGVRRDALEYLGRRERA